MEVVPLPKNDLLTDENSNPMTTILKNVANLTTLLLLTPLLPNTLLKTAFIILCCASLYHYTTSHVDLLPHIQTRPPILPTDKKTGSVLRDSATKSIRSSRGKITRWYNRCKHFPQWPSTPIQCGYSVFARCAWRSEFPALYYDVNVSINVCIVVPHFPRPQMAARLLVHKVHSPQEWEALQALMVCRLYVQCNFLRQKIYFFWGGGRCIRFILFDAGAFSESLATS